MTHRFVRSPWRRPWLPALFLAFLLTGCSDDVDVISGGGDTGVGSDGGSGSSQFAGTYSGTVTFEIRGDNVDDSTDTEAATVLIRSDGTGQLTIAGESVEGTVNGNRFGFSIYRRVRRDLVDCEGDATVTGTIQSGSLSGPVNGDGECDLLVGKTGFTLTGSIQATRN